jgi:hypothetical protein
MFLRLKPSIPGANRSGDGSVAGTIIANMPEGLEDSSIPSSMLEAEAILLCGSVVLFLARAHSFFSR